MYYYTNVLLVCCICSMHQNTNSAIVTKLQFFMSTASEQKDIRQTWKMCPVSRIFTHPLHLIQLHAILRADNGIYIETVTAASKQSSWQGVEGWGQLQHGHQAKLYSISSPTGFPLISLICHLKKKASSAATDTSEYFNPGTNITVSTRLKYHKSVHIIYTHALC